jgi:hypothetical protein
VVSTTQHHRFWDQTTATWTIAADLRPGVSTLASPDGTRQPVTAVANHTGDALMYDLTVADIHTYYVVAADTPVLVHNCGGGGAAERAAEGRTQGGVERTFENSLDKTTYLNDVASKNGINLRGSGQRISLIYDESLPVGQLGVTRASEGGGVIRVERDGTYDDATAANTIAHELSHARYYLRNGTFDGEVHGGVDSVADGTPYGSGNALQAWIEGLR